MISLSVCLSVRGAHKLLHVSTCMKAVQADHLALWCANCYPCTQQGWFVCLSVCLSVRGAHKLLHVATCMKADHLAFWCANNYACTQQGWSDRFVCLSVRGVHKLLHVAMQRDHLPLWCANNHLHVWLAPCTHANRSSTPVVLPTYLACSL